MQDGASISGEDAAAWLRDHFKHDAKPEIRVTTTWRDQEPNPTAKRRVLEILFAPRPDTPAA